MSDVCIKCAGKHRDFRTERTHLAMDPETGATIAEAHVRIDPMVESLDRDIAVEVRAVQNLMRTAAFARMQSRWVLSPADPRTIRENFSARIAAYLPRASYFTPAWTAEARSAFYGIKR